MHRLHYFDDTQFVLELKSIMVMGLLFFLHFYVDKKFSDEEQIEKKDEKEREI